MNRSSLHAFVATLALLHLLPAARANGVRLPSQDALAVARGYAWTATADNPSAIYYNPSGIAQLTAGEAQLSVHFLHTEASYSGAAGNTQMEGKTFPLPSFFAVQPLSIAGKAVVVGIGAYAPFGTETNWPASSPLATIATRNKVEFIRYAFTAATNLSDNVSVGASLQFNDIDVDLHRAIGLTPGDDFGFKGSAKAWSYNLGFMYRPTSEHSFGFQYQSRVSFGIDGTNSLTPYNVAEPGAVEWPFPQHFALGYSYRPSAAWNFEVGYDLTYWSTLKTLTLRRPVSGPLAIPFNWQNSAYYGVGATYYSGPFHYSAGVNYSENSVPSEWFSPTVPDATRVLFNAGVGYSSKAWRFESVLQVAPNTVRHISGSRQSAPFQTADGTYRAKLHGYTVQASYRW